MKTFLLLLVIVSLAVADPVGKKKAKKAKLFAKITKPFYKLPLLNLLASTTTTTPAPSHLKCDVIWEEKVTPLCKTKHNKLCEPEWAEHCHKVWEQECWEEGVEKCHDVQECHTESHNVCKTEYTIECEDPHAHHHDKHHHKRSVEMADRSAEVSADDLSAKSASLAHQEAAEASSSNRRHARAIPEQFSGLLGLGGTTTASTRAHVKETLCHHHPHTRCWDEPVEKCHAVPECHTEQVERCKKVPREVCEKVEKERCWEEPEEHCEYMRVKVAKKHCRKPKEW